MTPRRPWQRIAVWLLVAAASLVMVRLGFWQLDRLRQRRAQNRAVLQRWNAPWVDLNRMPWPTDPHDWDLRAAEAQGEFLPQWAFAVKNRVFQGQTGLHLVAPLRLEDRPGQAVLVVLGWLPMEYTDPNRWQAFIPRGEVTVRGRLFWPDEEAPPPTPGAAFPRLWYRLVPQAVQPYLPRQMRLAGWYLVWEPEPGRAPQDLPRRERLTLTLSEGPHLGYAVQWFAFAALLPVLVWKWNRG